MGAIGTSIGLGLKRAGLSETEIIGADEDGDALNVATKMGAVDQTSSHLGRALDGAQLVILAVPLPETRELLEAIGPVLEQGCVVTDTATVKTRVMEWAKEYLPRGTSYVGGRPIPKWSLISTEDADATVFEDTDYCVIPSSSAEPEAVKTIVGLVESLGARPLFLDAQEHDSFAAALTHLPAVISAALVTSTNDSAYWRDMAKLAGPEFSRLSSLAAFNPEESAAVSLANQDPLVRWLDRMIAELSSYREQIEKRDENLLERFIHAWEQRARWEAGVVDEGPEIEVPSAAQSIAGMVVGRRMARRFGQIVKVGKRPPWKYRSKNRS